MRQQFNDGIGRSAVPAGPRAGHLHGHGSRMEALRALGLGGILVINVRSFVERREHIERQLAAHGLECEFVHEFDANDIDPQTDQRYFDGPDLLRNVKSCSLKHLVALQRAATRGWDRVLVLEDDAVLLPGFSEGLERALAESRAWEGPHVVYLGSGGNQYTPRSQRRDGQSLYPNTRGRLTDSYVIGADAAAMRLAWMEANRMDHPIDHAFDRMDRELGIQILWFEDPIVEQGSKNGRFATSLEGTRPRWRQQFHFALKKVWQKHLRQLWR
ncbi:glycosyltransferase family 25 protein [Cupriavidus sp. AU9028]|uniref:glycosyltransferase family 25 protein n=1 Tax=Cupriavidus sp. AU9028 TaxID=2871157 RepID=UPI001C943622|nr:glycosyltransferase family 25 protein [Cupriavidus sp. AU9028]MBY4899044.1 glycosyltransferase family 25 protein [Cupriavidus sp. AU9028]